MPRMDGLELLSRIQKDPNLKHLPIAMLTSRGADRHRPAMGRRNAGAHRAPSGRPRRARAGHADGGRAAAIGRGAGQLQPAAHAGRGGLPDPVADEPAHASKRI